MKNEFKIDKEFIFNDRPVKIVSGTIHYFRVIPEYWEDRLLKLKAMGCNTVETYVPWNVHEPQKGTFDFNEQYNLTAFIELVEKCDLFLILRVSPYICAEWEFGGLPSWLLKDRNMRVRTTYPPFLKHLEEYFSVVLPKVTDYQIHKSGPIVLVQVENEYGYYSNDKEYLKTLVDMYQKYGIEVPLVSSDSTRRTIMNAGNLPGLAMPTVNCGANLKERLAILDEVNPDKPKMVMEFWIGWFNIWNNSSQQERPLAPIVKDLKDILDVGSVNIYMAHGGTNFGFMNGANYYEKEENGYYYEDYAPATTSYDYGAPISENGRLNERFYAYREAIKEALKDKFNETPIPADHDIKAYGKIALKEKVSLISVLSDISAPIYSTHLQTMEDIGQDYGYILYESTIDAKEAEEKIKLIDVEDRAHVFVNDQLAFIDYKKEYFKLRKIQLENNRSNNLKILVENMGRANLGPHMNDQRKGIKGAVMISEFQQTGWAHYPIDLKDISTVDFNKDYETGQPGFYKFEFDIKEPEDTYIKLPGWGKGVIFVNGFNIGRFWEVGPQHSYYIPGPKLKMGKNEIVVFESDGKAGEFIELIDELVITSQEDK